MCDFKKYSELILSLLVAEKNNELFIKNYQSCPTGSVAFPEVNAAFSKNYGRGYNHGRGRGRRHGRGRGRGRSGFYNPSQNNVIHKKHHVDKHDKGKVFMKFLFKILKFPIITMASKGTRVEYVEHQSTFVSFTRHS